jgi:hypothetical protein
VRKNFMAKTWFVQVHPAEGPAKNPVYFDDFVGTLAFVRDFKKGANGDTLRVHIPAMATNDERQQLKDLGCVPC